MPIALWSPVRSFFCGINAIVTSPGEPAGSRGGTGKRSTLAGRRSSHFGRATTLVGSKCFQPRIVLAEDASARIVVLVPEDGSVLRLAS